jgi:hypothetical protein
MPDDPAGIISAADLNRLVDLFPQFEGASNPFAASCREAEYEFNALVEKLHAERIAPQYHSITLSQFRSYTRNYCRLRISKQGPPFPCV